jgi:hypothetical protein
MVINLSKGNATLGARLSNIALQRFDSMETEA